MIIHNGLFDSAQPQFLFSPNDDGGGGNGNGNNADNESGGNDNDANNGGGTPSPKTNKLSKEEIERLVQETLNKHLSSNNGDKDATLFELTKKLHGVEKQRDDARANSLSEADRKKFDAFKALGQSPDELQTRLKDGEAAIGEARGMKRDVLLSKANKNAEAFNKLRGTDEWTLGEKTETRDGKEIKIVTAKVADGDEKPLDELLTEHFGSLADSVNLSGDSARSVSGYGKGAAMGGGKVQDRFERIREAKRAENKEATPSMSWQEQAGVRPV